MSFVTADQLATHAVGDYVLQSDWMAREKTGDSFPAAVHALTYTLPFTLLSMSPRVLAAIAVTHFIIDRWRLARFVVWAKNWLSPDGYAPWRFCRATGYYDKGPPPWMAVWLLIIADNVLHVLINAAALRWLS